MPSLQIELAHLAKADRHVAIARDNLATAEAAALREPQPADAHNRLVTLRQTLAAFEAHRALIANTIEDLRNGLLPDRTNG